MKKVIVLLLVLVMVFSFAACSADTAKDTTKGGSNKEATGEKPKLIVSTLYGDEGVTELKEVHIFTPLKNAFPDVDLQIEVYPDRKSMQVQVAGGGGPDILDLDGPTDAVEYAKAGRIVDLDGYNEQFGWEDMFFDWAWGTSFYDGKLYSLPNSFEGMVLYCNTDVFEEQGWKIPETMDEMIEVMDAAQAAGIIPLSFGNSNYQGAVDWLYSTFISGYAGPEVVKDAIQGNNGVTFNSELMEASVNMMVDWWKKGYIGDKKSQSITTDDINAFFADGKAAMMINGTWAATSLTSTYPETNWKIILMPELREGVGRILPIATGGCFAINANSKYPDISAEVMDWFFTSMDRHIRSVEVGNMQPYPLKTFDVAELKEMDPRVSGMYDILMQAQKDNQIGYCSWTFYPSDARVYMNEKTDGLFLDLLTVQEYMSETQTFIDKAIEEGNVPLIP